MSEHGVGIIGCGAIFVMHGASLKAIEGVKVRAVCDVKRQAAEAAAAYMGCDACFDHHDMLKRADIDTVHVLTPHHLHPVMAVEAMRAGKNVLVEKPMAITAEDAEEMNNVSRQTGRTLGVVSQNRYNAASIAIKNALVEGGLGRVLSAKVLLTWAKPSDYYRNSEWRGTWDKEGGALLIDQAIHVLDLARWFIDQPVKTIEATIANRMHPMIETEDTAEGTITFEGGTYAIFYASNCYTTNSPVEVQIHCDNGLAALSFDTAVISYNDGRELHVTNNPADSFEYGEFKGIMGPREIGMAMEALAKWGLAQVPMPVTWKQPKPYWGFSHIRQIRDYYASLDNGKPPAVDGWEAIKTHKMIMGIYRSAKAGTKISL